MSFSSPSPARPEPARRACLGALAGTLAASLLAPEALAGGLDPESRLPGARVSAPVRLTVWGLAIYDARLWALPDFRPEAFAQHPLVLELRYLRAFAGADIARRSIQEMQQLSPLTPAQTQDWRSSMQALFPDVQSGDRLAGRLQPGQPTTFWHNERPLGAVQDPAFGPRFFGIWLDPRTRAPALRTGLLQGLT